MSLSMDRLWSSHAYSYSCFWTIVYCHGFLLVSVVLGKWRVTFVLPRLVFLGFTWWWIVDPFICNRLLLSDSLLPPRFILLLWTVCCPQSLDCKGLPYRFHFKPSGFDRIHIVVVVLLGFPPFVGFESQGINRSWAWWSRGRAFCLVSPCSTILVWLFLWLLLPHWGQSIPRQPFILRPLLSFDVVHVVVPGEDVANLQPS